MCEFVCVRPTLLYPPRANKFCNTEKVEDLFFHCGWKSFIKDTIGIGDKKTQNFNIIHPSLDAIFTYMIPFLMIRLLNGFNGLMDLSMMNLRVS